MEKHEQFAQVINEGYTFKGGALTMGVAMLDGQPVPGALVKAPLSTMNRHGLVAGATGTGKTKTLQRLVESLSKNGVPVLIMDIKGDVSGISQPGTSNSKIDERHAKIGEPWAAAQFPVEFLSISNEKGTKMRATVSEFGPVLFSKILELNDTQSSVCSLIFKYCDDKGLALLDLQDFKKTLQYLTNEGKEEIEQEYGAIASSSTAAMMRKVIELEEQGAELFFGEKSFDVEDLLRKDREGRGYVNIIRLSDMQAKPKLFSTFMLCLLAEIYQTFPEEGDIEKPKLVFIIDEAHLIFNEASKALLDQLETIIKLIRSKGVGIYFCTQNPIDIPPAILSQLGMKIQHALRAFTANDRKAIKLAAENYPLTDFYQVDETITALGTGEAFFTALNEKGIPTPLAHVLLCAPESRMDTITDAELDKAVERSDIASTYNKVIDRESAAEILGEKIKRAQDEAQKAKEAEERDKEDAAERKRRKDAPTFLESVGKNPIVRDVGRTLSREIVRGILGVLGIRRRR